MSLFECNCAGSEWPQHTRIDKLLFCESALTLTKKKSVIPPSSSPFFHVSQVRNLLAGFPVLSNGHHHIKQSRLHTHGYPKTCHTTVDLMRQACRKILWRFMTGDGWIGHGRTLVVSVAAALPWFSCSSRYQNVVNETQNAVFSWVRLYDNITFETTKRFSADLPIWAQMKKVHDKIYTGPYIPQNNTSKKEYSITMCQYLTVNWRQGSWTVISPTQLSTRDTFGAK